MIDGNTFRIYLLKGTANTARQCTITLKTFKGAVERLIRELVAEKLGDKDGRKVHVEEAIISGNGDDLIIYKNYDLQSRYEFKLEFAAGVEKIVDEIAEKWAQKNARVFEAFTRKRDVFYESYRLKMVVSKYLEENLKFARQKLAEVEEKITALENGDGDATCEPEPLTDTGDLPDYCEPEVEGGDVTWGEGASRLDELKSELAAAIFIRIAIERAIDTGYCVELARERLAAKQKEIADLEKEIADLKATGKRWELKRYNAAGDEISSVIYSNADEAIEAANADRWARGNLKNTGKAYILNTVQYYYIGGESKKFTEMTAYSDCDWSGNSDAIRVIFGA